MISPEIDRLLLQKDRALPGEGEPSVPPIQPQPHRPLAPLRLVGAIGKFDVAVARFPLVVGLCSQTAELAVNRDRLPEFQTPFSIAPLSCKPWHLVAVANGTEDLLEHVLAKVVGDPVLVFAAQELFVGDVDGCIGLAGPVMTSPLDRVRAHTQEEGLAT